MTSAERDMMACFRADYLQMLDGRLEGIVRLLAAQQFEAAHVTLLSLESSSGMLGAAALVDAVKRLRAALEQEHFDQLGTLTDAMIAEAEQVRGQLGGRAG